MGEFEETRVNPVGEKMIYLYISSANKCNLSMKLHILTHNLRGLNDPLSVLKHNIFLWSITPRVDVLVFQEHKLKGAKLEKLDQRLMSWSTRWILEAKLGCKSWLNPNGGGKGRVGILLASKFTCLVIALGALINNIVVWIKMDGIEGDSLGIACVYAPNIPSHRKELWEEMMERYLRIVAR